MDRIIWRRASNICKSKGSCFSIFSELIGLDIDSYSTSVKIDFQIGNPIPKRIEGPARLPNITRCMALSYEYNKLLDKGYSIKDIAEYEGVNESFMLKIVKMVFLSPKIQEKILLLQRTHRSTLFISVKQLIEIVKIVDFEDQEKALDEIWR